MYDGFIEHHLSRIGFEIKNLREDHRRDGHINLKHDDAIRINKVLKDNNVTPDYRAPNVMLLSPIVLYTLHTMMFGRLFKFLKTIMDEEQSKKIGGKQDVVA